MCYNNILQRISINSLIIPVADFISTYVYLNIIIYIL